MKINLWGACAALVLPMSAYSGSAQPPLKMLPLAWESNQTNKKWSEYLFKQLDNNFESLEKAKDIEDFCPNYKNLDRKQKVNVWGQIIASMSFYESTFNPTARLAISTPGIDPVTNRQISSEGLLQLGYLDSKYHGCNFDWEADSELAPDDPRKTILNPYNNLACGVKIITKQIKQYEAIAVDKGAYWAVIKVNHRDSKIPQIKNMVSDYSICKVES